MKRDYPSMVALVALLAVAGYLSGDNCEMAPRAFESREHMAPAALIGSDEI
jgi:hypothetical protein